MVLEEATENDSSLKVKIFFERQAFVIYLPESIMIDAFFAKIREILKFTTNQLMTVKWIDNEGLKILEIEKYSKFHCRRSVHDFFPA